MVLPSKHTSTDAAAWLRSTMIMAARRLLTFTHMVDSLATNTTYVQGRLAEDGNDLLSLGADGFRLDAAKRALTSRKLSISVTRAHNDAPYHRYRCY